MGKTNFLFANPIVDRTGLGNMLFPWARAEVFARNHQCSVLAPKWTHWMRIGPWLRREKDKRYYLQLFSNEGYVTGFKRYWILLSKQHLTENEFAQNNPGGFQEKKTVVLDFMGMEGLFQPFLSSQAYVRERLYAITHPKINASVVADGSLPFIGVHIRRGDFKQAGFSIPLEWYAKAIAFAKSNIRVRGVDVNGLPVRVFTDDVPGVLDFFQNTIPNIGVMPNRLALQDLWLLSKASILIGTSRSTFSMWAVFLGQMPSVWHPSDVPPRMLVEENESPFLFNGDRGDKRG